MISGSGEADPDASCKGLDRHPPACNDPDNTGWEAWGIVDRGPIESEPGPRTRNTVLSILEDSHKVLDDERVSLPSHTSTGCVS